MLHQRGRRRENLCARQQFFSTLRFSRLWAGRQPLTVATVAIPPSQPWQQHLLLLLFALGVSILVPQQDAEPEPSPPSRLEALRDAGGEQAGEGSYLVESTEATGEKGTPAVLGRGWAVGRSLTQGTRAEDGEKNRRRSLGYRSWQFCPQKPPSRWLHYPSSLLLTASPDPTAFSSLLLQHRASLSLAALFQPSSIPPASPLQLPAALRCLQQAPAPGNPSHPYGTCLLLLKMCILISSLNLSSVIFITFYYAAVIC